MRIMTRMGAAALNRISEDTFFLVCGEHLSLNSNNNSNSSSGRH
jgi:GTP-dependent phosphoenolpyruvate carboxykinase